MQNLILSFLDDWSASLGVEVLLLIALLVVAVALGIASIVFAVLRLIIFWNYWLARRTVASGATGAEAATQALHILGADDVKVEKEGFFRALLYNNHYNPSKKTVYLRRTTYNGKSATAIALSVQKAALTKQDRENSGKFRARWRLQRLAVFGTIFFIPLIAVGAVIDCLVGFTGVPLLIASVVALAFFIASMVLTGLTVTVERRGTKDAYDLLEETVLLTPEETEKARRVLKTYIIAYVTDFIIAILKVVQLILKILINTLAIFSKKKN